VVNGVGSGGHRYFFAFKDSHGAEVVLPDHRFAGHGRLQRGMSGLQFGVAWRMRRVRSDLRQPGSVAESRG